MSLFIQVTIYDDETGEVERVLADHYGDNLGYEVSRLFDQMGEKVRKIVDPSSDD